MPATTSTQASHAPGDTLAPPEFSLTASRFLYDPDLPDHLFRTYARITGLAWQQQNGSDARYVATPPLTIYELATICSMSKRSLWRQLTELVSRGLLKCEAERTVQTRFIFYPVWPAAQAPPKNSTPDTAPAPLPDTVSDALAEFGVDADSPPARRAGALPHVTPGLIRAWGHHLQRRPGIHNLPGLLLHVLQRHTEPPDADPERAAGRPPTPTPPPATDELPADLVAALKDAGWDGDDAWAEVAAILREGQHPGARRGLDFVWAWLHYLHDHPGLGAGFLRSRLRGSAWPPQPRDPQQEKQARRLAKWRAEAGAAPRAPRAPSPAEVAIARYGIHPDTMALWEQTSAALSLQMTRATFDTWLRSALLLSLENGRATLGVRHPHGVEWVQHRLDTVILRALSRHLGHPVEALHVVVLDQARSA